MPGKAADGNDDGAVFHVEYGGVIVARRGNECYSHIAVRRGTVKDNSISIQVRREGIEGRAARCADGGIRI